MDPVTLVIVLGIVGAGAFLLTRPAALPPLGTPGNPLTPGPGQGVSAPPLSVTAGTGSGPGTQGSTVAAIVSAGGAAAVAAIPLITGTGVAAGAAAGGAAAAGTAGTSTTATAGTAGAGAGISAATAAITAGVGVAVTIFVILWNKHLARVKQAKDENSAMNLGVDGFDSDLKQVNAAWNAGQLDMNTAISASQQVLAQWWALVTPHIQPGRNGCGGGNGCATVIAQGNALIAKGKDSCNDYPGSAIGAVCCVGCFALHQAIYGNADGSIPGVVKVLQQGGGVTQIPKVFPSKYGGLTRAAYSLTWNHA